MRQGLLGGGAYSWCSRSRLRTFLYMWLVKAV